MALAGSAAPLRDVRDPAEVTRAFPRRAKLRIVNVWATWCVPCVAEMGDLRAIDEAFGPEVAIVGVTLDDMIPGDRAVTKTKVERFLAQRRISFPNLYYVGNADALGDALRFDGEIPLTVIYGRDGRELWRHQGRLDRRATEQTIRDLLRRNR
ncbi:MAG TPA: TlpA disulfide reductase family protein [Thermoanaerobaculia bacterium]|nr:TlpA disulfide reductase family protein [Thermoanaerobaculia bacterium]